MTKDAGVIDYLEPVDVDRLAIAGMYDELPLWSAPFGLRLLDRVRMRPGFTYLDVGAGTGFMSLELAQRCGPGSVVIAVDPWAAAMDQLARKAAHLQLSNIRLLQQDAATIDVADASVDVIVSNLGLNNFDNADAVLATCRRVAKTGGQLILTTNLVGHMREFYDIFHETLENLGMSEQIPALEAHVQHRATVEGACRRLERAGFFVTQATTESIRMRFADGSSLLRHHFIRLGFMQGWKAIVPAEAAWETFTTLERALNEAANANGELALSIPMACIEART